MTGEAAPAPDGEEPPSGGLSGFFIRRPIATYLLMVGVFLIGLAAYLSLPVAALPDVAVATMQVAAELPGADARTNADAVTGPLERQFAQVPGVKQMTSSSALGYSQVSLQFAETVTLDRALATTQAAIAAAAGDLPATLPSPPTFRAINPADPPALILGVSSDTLPLTTVDDYAESLLAPALSRQPGVGLVTIGGQQQPAMRVEVDPAKLAARGLALADVRAALSGLTLDAAKGTIRGTRQTWGLSTNDQLTAGRDYADAVIAYRDGAPIRVRDVGAAAVGPATDQLAGWVGRRRAIVLNVLPEAGANIIETVDAIKKDLPRLRADLPAAVEVDVVSDRTTTIRASVADVERTLLLIVFLVVATIFVFLRDARATFIPALAIPLSIFATFAVMKACGFSLDNLSLMGLSIAVGFVVDDAVVMIENIERHMEEGVPPLKAALAGAGEIGFTVVAISFSLVAVFLPLFLMGGLVGRMFREFAVVVAVAVVMSVFVSLTLTPTLCARMLRPPRERREGRVAGWLRRGTERLERGYARGLDLVLRHQTPTLVTLVVTIALTAFLYAAIPKGFFPRQDTGLLAGITEAGQDISTEGLGRRQQQVVDIVLRDPAVQSVASYIGPGPSSPAPNQGRMFVALKPLDDRGEDGSAFAVVRRIEARAAKLAGIRLYLQAAQDITIGARVAKSPYQFTLVSADPAALSAWAKRARAALARIPGLTDVASDAAADGPRLAIHIDRGAAARYGITPQAIDEALYDAFGERVATKVYTAYNTYDVILEVAKRFRLDPGALDLVFLRTAGGQSVPLRTVASVAPGVAPILVNHQDGLPSVTLSFGLEPGVSIGAAVDAVDKVKAQLDMPASVRSSFQGNAAAFQTALAGQGLLVLVTLLVVYLILGMFYQDLVLPLTILSTLPAAGLGALLTLWLFGRPLDVIGIIGIVLLIGIVKKNGIMLADFAVRAERDGKAPRDAIRAAAIDRFRPILMTTICAMLGGVPLMLGTGIGSQIRQPLGFAIVGGLAVSQVLTLFTTPVIYLFMQRTSARARRGVARLRGRHGGRPAGRAA